MNIPFIAVFVFTPYLYLLQPHIPLLDEPPNQLAVPHSHLDELLQEDRTPRPVMYGILTRGDYLNDRPRLVLLVSHHSLYSLHGFRVATGRFFFDLILLFTKLSQQKCCTMEQEQM